MTNRAYGWAARAPKWASPPGFMMDISDYRRDIIKSVGSTWAHDDETFQQGWQRAYRRGWRAVKVMVIEQKEPPL